MQSHTTRAVLRIVLPYALFAGLWILLSDRVLDMMPLDPAAHTRWSILKGWAFVFVTALLLWFLLQGEFRARARDHAASRAARRRLADIIEFLPDATLVIDADKRVVAWNRACETLTGVGKEEVMGKGDYAYAVPFFGERRPMLVDLLDAPDPALEETYAILRREGDKIIAEAFLPKLNEGRGAHIWGVAGPLFDQEGRRSGAVEEIRDITEQRRARDQIHDLHQALSLHAAELEERVEHRTAELEVAKRRAEESDRLKSAFLATMSHELRTPLNSIIGFTGIILQGLTGPLTREQEKQLGMVRGSARHLLALINDVLDISKIEAGQLEVTREPFDLRASLGKVMDLLRPLAAEKGLVLREEIDPEIGTLVSDPRRVEQILINLLNNAVKFTAEGEVGLAATLEEGGLRVSVWDTGPGIKPEDMTQLFRPFRQIDTGLTRSHEGTGLGLAISRRLAELLGGEVLAESRWGQGSTFSLLLPLAEGGPE